MRLSRSPAVHGVAGPPLGADTRTALTRAGLPADLVDTVAPTTAPTTTPEASA